MALAGEQPGRLIVTADDWGYSARYNEGIEQAARAGALDAVSAMVMRPQADPGRLLDCEVEVGLHIEEPEGRGRREVLDAPWRQAEDFGRLFGRPPAFIDGHHHCHALLPIATAVEDLALELRVPVRGVGEDHRFRLDERGIASPDRVVGRLHEDEPAVPRVLSEALEEDALPWGTTEWVVHPGHSDPGSGSSYDRGREEDLATVIELAANELLAAARSSHRDALSTAASG